MKKYSTPLTLLALFALSAGLYLIQIDLYRDNRDTGFYLLQDIAFLPVQIAVVTIVVGRVIGQREKRERLAKTRMLAGSFFSELGTDLLAALVPCVENPAALSPVLAVSTSWGTKEFRAASAAMGGADLRMCCGEEELAAVKELLVKRRLSMLVLASNPALLEHENFTDMLWTVFHMTDELISRTRLDNLSKEELAHLNEDAQRLLQAILMNWICHMDHIRVEYPYLFTMAVQQNPLRPAAGN